MYEAGGFAPPDKKYDPVKRHEYYEAHKQLKGRSSSGMSSSSGRRRGGGGRRRNPKVSKAASRVARLRGKVKKLKDALRATEEMINQKRDAAVGGGTTSSSTSSSSASKADGKTTASERLASKEYRDKHQTELAQKRKQAAPSTSSSTPASKPSNDISSMDIDSLMDRAKKLRALIKEAQRQLANASSASGKLVHSAIISDPDVNEHFAQFKSAERTPS